MRFAITSLTATATPNPGHLQRGYACARTERAALGLFRYGPYLHLEEGTEYSNDESSTTAGCFFPHCSSLVHAGCSFLLNSAGGTSGCITLREIPGGVG